MRSQTPSSVGSSPTRGTLSGVLATVESCIQDTRATKRSGFVMPPNRLGGLAALARYPRWQFTNVSGDIRELCCWALDLVGIAWRQSNPRVISVSRREAVAALDDLIGMKS
jgi:hypothetical protein